MMPSRAPARLLFVDQSGEPGGAELCLLDLLAEWQRTEADSAGTRRVILLQDGPFAGLLREAGLNVEIEAMSAAVGATRRAAGLAGMLRVLPASLSLIRRLAARAREHDVVYANTQKAFVIGVLAARLAGRPCIWHLHDILTADHFSPPLRRLVVLLANHYCARVIANSAATVAAFVAAGGRRELCEVIYNGFDPARFAPLLPPQREALRLGLGAGAQVPLLGVFSRLAPWKGQHVLLQALREIPQAQALLVGAPLFGEQAYADTLAAQSETPELRGRVHFAGFRQDIPALLGAVDIALHTSTSPEPFGRVVVEAMLAGRPVIAAAAGGVTELIEPGVSGLLVPPGDASALAEAIRGLLANPDRAQAMGEAARQRAVHWFDIRNTLAATRTAIAAVIASGAASAR